MNFRNLYELWLQKAVSDQDLILELQEMAGDDTAIEDAFYRELEFGTGGLRGLIGAGLNRMNIYTVGKVSQGLADYVNRSPCNGNHAIAISYDSRIKSQLFARTAAEVFAANNIQVFLYSELMPTPCLSFAVRALGCAAGVMVTASHNPAQYNGYKVYGGDGCQITTQAAEEISAMMTEVDVFTDIRRMPFAEGMKKGLIQWIPETVYTAFVEAVKAQSMLTADAPADKHVAIVYSPLHGTGLKPVLRALTEAGYTNITRVKEQETPDGLFPTCPYPNPEIKEAMALGMGYAKTYHADLFLATDPDCDRVGVAVRKADGDYALLSGNETGVLLLDYLCSRRCFIGAMPKDPVLVKTIVTTDMAQRIAADYGVDTVNVLTGFKFIGEQIGLLEQQGKADSYLFGFEESCGYLSGPYVRDKDGVGGVFLICEMAAYYKARGVSLLERLEELYKTYGYYRNTVYSYTFEGPAGLAKMQAIMEQFRRGAVSFGGLQIQQCLDYGLGLDSLPKSNVLKFLLEDDSTVVIRPSGTEPKLKIYVSVRGESRDDAAQKENQIARSLVF